MATPEEILQRQSRIDAVNAIRRANKANPIDYTADDNTLSQAENWDYTTNKLKGTATPPKNLIQTGETVRTKTYSKPEAVDDDTHNALLSSGVSPERIAELYAPNEKNPFSRIFKEEAVEPTPLTESQLTASRNLANLGEGVKVLGDMFGVSKGAHITRREAGAITNAQQATETTERDKYLAKLDQFNQGKKNAAEKDWMLMLNDKEKKVAQIRADIEADRKNRFAEKKLAQDYEISEKTFGLEKDKAKTDSEYKRVQNKATLQSLEKDDEYFSLNIEGKPVRMLKTFKDDIIGRVRAEFGGKGTDRDGKPIVTNVDNKTDDELFREYSPQYLKLGKDGKTVYVAYERGKFQEEQGTPKVNVVTTKSKENKKSTAGQPNKYSFKLN